MVKLVVAQPSRSSATERLKSSRVGPWPGIRLRSTKAGAASSSMTSRFPLASSCSNRRTMALFSSADDKAPSSSWPTYALPMDRHHEHDATRRTLAHRLEPYSPKFVDGEVSSEVQIRGPL